MFSNPGTEVSKARKDDRSRETHVRLIHRGTRDLQKRFIRIYEPRITGVDFIFTRTRINDRTRAVRATIVLFFLSRVAKI